jgi:hypothetical protein
MDSGNKSAAESSSALWLKDFRWAPLFKPRFGSYRTIAPAELFGKLSVSNFPEGIELALSVFCTTDSIGKGTKIVEIHE